MADKKKSLIIVVSAPSGSGKTTIVDSLMCEMSGIRRSVSFTTREPREGEEPGADYIFITKEEFLERIDKNDFIEWEENFGYYYGTSRTQLDEAADENSDIILSIDVKGARKVKEAFPGSISIFVMPPSFEELEKRLVKRNTDEKEQVARRLKEAKREISASDEYDYMIVNDNVETAIKELKTIIEEERKNRDNITEEQSL